MWFRNNSGVRSLVTKILLSCIIRICCKYVLQSQMNSNCNDKLTNDGLQSYSMEQIYLSRSLDIVQTVSLNCH